MVPGCMQQLSLLTCGKCSPCTHRVSQGQAFSLPFSGDISTAFPALLSLSLVSLDPGAVEPQRVLGQSGDTAWPACSPDSLSPGLKENIRNSSCHFMQHPGVLSAPCASHA